MIEQDLKAQGCTCKHITDEVIENPEMIEVGANEAVYIHYFYVTTSTPIFWWEYYPIEDYYDVELVSPNTVVRYNELNTSDGISNRITRHRGNIKFKGILPNNFFVHFLRVKF